MIGRTDDRSPRQLFVVVAIFYILGIYIGRGVSIDPMWILGATVVGVGCVIWLGRWWCMAATLLTLGVYMSVTWRADLVPLDSAECVVEVESHQSLRVELYRSGGEWHSADEVIYFWMADDVEWRPEIGDRHIVRLSINRRDGWSRTYINSDDLLAELPPARGVRSVARRVNNWMYGRLKELGMDSDSESVCAAMLLGRREAMSQELESQYIRSGNAHVLAVSGLHLGLLAIVMGIILRPLHLLRYGIVWNRLALMLFTIFYAVVVGLSPSIMRAAVMAILVGFSVVATRRYNLLTSLAVAAFMLLTIDPTSLFEASFALSFIAVLAIALWVIPLTSAIQRWTRDRSWPKGVKWIVNTLSGVVILSLCCTAATIPYTANTFGTIAIFGALASPIIMITAFVTLFAAMVWCIVGIAALAPIFAWTIEIATQLQNNVTHYLSSNWRNAIEVNINEWWALTIYLIFALLTLVAYILSARKQSSLIKNCDK